MPLLVLVGRALTTTRAWSATTAWPAIKRALRWSFMTKNGLKTMFAGVVVVVAIANPAAATLFGLASAVLLLGLAWMKRHAQQSRDTFLGRKPKKK